LTDYAILNPINVDENGNTSPEEYIYVWANTRWDGTIYEYASTCLNWTSESQDERGSGTYPQFNDYQWSLPAFTALCNSTLIRLYCFEQ